jgi:hypothetical protein
MWRVEPPEPTSWLSSSVESISMRQVLVSHKRTRAARACPSGQSLKMTGAIGEHTDDQCTWRAPAPRDSPQGGRTRLALILRGKVKALLNLRRLDTPGAGKRLGRCVDGRTARNGRLPCTTSSSRAIHFHISLQIYRIKQNMLQGTAQRACHPAAIAAVRPDARRCHGAARKGAAASCRRIPYHARAPDTSSPARGECDTVA